MNERDSGNSLAMEALLVDMSLQVDGMSEWLYGDTPDASYDFEGGALLQINHMKLTGDDLLVPITAWAPMFVPQAARNGAVYGTLFGGRSTLGTMFPLEHSPTSRYIVDSRGSTITANVCHRSSTGLVELMTFKFLPSGDMTCSNYVYERSNPSNVYFGFTTRERKLCSYCERQGFTCECEDTMRTKSLTDIARESIIQGICSSNSQDLHFLNEALCEVFKKVFLGKFQVTGVMSTPEGGSSMEMVHHAVSFPKFYNYAPSGYVAEAARIKCAQTVIMHRTGPRSPMLLTDSSSNASGDGTASVRTDADAPEDELTCQICGAQFTRKHDTRRHVRTVHLQQRNFKCEMCNRQFIHRTHLRDHIYSVHIKVALAKCPECGKGFKNQSKVNRHILSVHKGERKYQCTQCGRRFFQRWDLKKHMEVHLAKGL
eukprot:CAMPEP_0113960710 /NCGR_PEP_ID=MMETSP0011_2-20120614/4877_1 /TAXON_ID=101924 /ORGANISM="Rhodosorus marinus" /LENGTH=428 /DNA_ID=CAMNT_0000972215 /DNA_START=251 /DNA_END=1537 /DNA_ORIENTATION=- /assembly_acc=CAM_ASM_000156